MNRSIVWGALVAFGSAGCQQLGDGVIASERGADDDGPVRIGIVWPKDHDGAFYDGVTLAEAESKGMVLGRPLELEKRETTAETLLEAKTIAQSLCDDPNVVAVIGHRDPAAARAVSILYEYADIVMLAPTTHPSLTRPGFSRVFQALPDDENFGAAIADRIHDLDLDGALILYTNDQFGRALANSFESRAEARRIRILERVPVDRGGLASFERMLRTLDATRVGAVLLAVGRIEAQPLLDGLRSNGVQAPVFAPIGMDGKALDVTVASVFDPAVPNDSTRAFIDAFQERFEAPPDVWAYAGYEAVRQLRAAITAAGSTQPKLVANALRDTGGFDALGARAKPRIMFVRRNPSESYSR